MNSRLMMAGFLLRRGIGQMNQAILGFFSTPLSLVVGASVVSRYPLDLQYGGFWLTGLIISVIFYLDLQRWHTTPQMGHANALAVSPSIMI